MGKFTEEEIKALKEIAQNQIRFNDTFTKDENGNKIPQGNYSDYVKAMKGDLQSA